MTTRRPLRFSAGLLLAVFVQQSPTSAQDPLSIHGPQILDSKEGKIRVVPVATGLFHPWSLAFADARTLLVTERNGRLRVIRDGALLVTVGDRDRLCCTGTEDNSLRMKAQSLENHVGKTLRLRDDGTVPADNPFVGRAGAKPEIYTYGHRNGYGLAVNPETGELWQAEIGPMGGDEVNILLPGHNYGWPLVSTGRNYTGKLVSDQPWARPGMDNPRIHRVPSISPSSIIFYTGDKFPKWKNNLFIGALTTAQLIRMAFGQPSQAEKREGLLVPLEQRVRDVIQGPDGYLYVATEATFQSNAADGAVLRIEPADQ